MTDCRCDCGRPCRNTYALLDSDGLHPICAYCLIEILPAIELAGSHAIITIHRAKAVAR